MADEYDARDPSEPMSGRQIASDLPAGNRDPRGGHPNPGVVLSNGYQQALGGYQYSAQMAATPQDRITASAYQDGRMIHSAPHAVSASGYPRHRIHGPVPAQPPYDAESQDESRAIMGEIAALNAQMQMMQGRVGSETANAVYKLGRFVGSLEDANKQANGKQEHNYPSNRNAGFRHSLLPQEYKGPAGNLADASDIRVSLVDLERRLRNIESFVSTINDDGLAELFPRLNTRLKLIESDQKDKENHVDLIKRGNEPLEQRTDSGKRPAAQAHKGRPAGPASTPTASPSGARPLGRKRDLEQYISEEVRKKVKKGRVAEGNYKAATAQFSPDLSSPKDNSIADPKKFLEFLHNMGRSDHDVQRLNRIVNGPISLEFLLFTNHRGDKEDHFFLKVGGRMRSQIRPHDRSSFDVKVKNQKPEEEMRAKELGWLECIFTASKKTGETGPVQLPQYLLQLGEVYGLSKVRSGGVPDRVSSTNFFVLLDLSGRTTSLWMVYKYAENARPGPSEGGLVAKSRELIFKNPFNVGKVFDIVRLVEDVRLWKDTNRFMLSGDNYFEVFKQGSQLKPELILPLMANVDKMKNSKKRGQEDAHSAQYTRSEFAGWDDLLDYD